MQREEGVTQRGERRMRRDNRARGRIRRTSLDNKAGVLRDSEGNRGKNREREREKGEKERCGQRVETRGTRGTICREAHTLITRMLYARWWDTYVWALVSKLRRKGIHEYRGTNATRRPPLLSNERVVAAAACHCYCHYAVALSRRRVSAPGVCAAGKLRPRRIKLKPSNAGRDCRDRSRGYKCARVGKIRDVLENFIYICTFASSNL